MAADTRSQTGFYCSTSGTYFNDKESLAEHYKSDFHRYNLKRKVAGLPPVTKDWFDARKEQLAQTTPSEAVHKIWIDPLTKKKFSSENTYQAHLRSKKYQDLLRKTGEPAPEPVIVTRKVQDKGAEVQKQLMAEAQKTAGYVLKPASKSLPTPQAGEVAPTENDVASDESEDEVASLEGSGWETASDDEVDASPEAEWDVKRSFFDNFVSASFDANLEYMYRNFGFYLPDTEYLADPEGLIKYLGAKLTQGRIPLNSSGNNPNARRFRSLHAVQRHMVDTQQCRMLFEDNEEEYEEFYDYSSLNAQDESEGTALVAADDEAPLSLAAGGYELVVAGQGDRPGRVLGSRELARYYKQRHKSQDVRLSVAINTVLAKYRALAIATREEHSEAKAAQVRASRKAQMRLDRNLVRSQIWGNKIKDLPSCVPY